MLFPGSNGQTTSEKYYNPALTGVRFVAAALIYIFHFHPWSNHLGRFPKSALDELYIGVSIFFVLSGHLITKRYAQESLPSCRWYFSYLRNRLARVYPLAFVVSLVALIYTQQANLSTWLVYLSLTPAWFDSTIFSAAPHLWTLTEEECFYISSPFLTIALRRLPLLVVTGLLYIVGIALVLISHQLHLDPFLPTLQFMFTYSFFGRAFEFLCGAYLPLHGSKIAALQYRHLSLASLLGITAAVMLLVISKQGQGILAFHAIPGLVLHNTLLPLPTALFIYSLDLRKGFLYRMLSNRVAVTLGKISFASYLIHDGFFMQMARDLCNNGFVMTTILLLAFSALLHFIVEEPLRRCFTSDVTGKYRRRKLAPAGEPKRSL